MKMCGVTNSSSILSTQLLIHVPDISLARSEDQGSNHNYFMSQSSYCQNKLLDILEYENEIRSDFDPLQRLREHINLVESLPLPENCILDPEVSTLARLEIKLGASLPQPSAEPFLKIPVNLNTEKFTSNSIDDKPKPQPLFDPTLPDICALGTDTASDVDFEQDASSYSNFQAEQIFKCLFSTKTLFHQHNFLEPRVKVDSKSSDSSAHEIGKPIEYAPFGFNSDISPTSNTLNDIIDDNIPVSSLEFLSNKLESPAADFENLDININENQSESSHKSKTSGSFLGNSKILKDTDIWIEYGDQVYPENIPNELALLLKLINQNFPQHILTEKFSRIETIFRTIVNLQRYQKQQILFYENTIKTHSVLFNSFRESQLSHLLDSFSSTLLKTLTFAQKKSELACESQSNNELEFKNITSLLESEERIKNITRSSHNILEGSLKELDSLHCALSSKCMLECQSNYHHRLGLPSTREEMLKLSPTQLVAHIEMLLKILKEREIAIFKSNCDKPDPKIYGHIFNSTSQPTSNITQTGLKPESENMNFKPCKLSNKLSSFVTSVESKTNTLCEADYKLEGVGNSKGTKFAIEKEPQNVSQYNHFLGKNTFMSEWECSEQLRIKPNFKKNDKIISVHDDQSALISSLQEENRKLSRRIITLSQNLVDVGEESALEIRRLQNRENKLMSLCTLLDSERQSLKRQVFS